MTIQLLNNTQTMQAQRARTQRHELDALFEIFKTLDTNTIDADRQMLMLNHVISMSQDHREHGQSKSR